ncbi:MAG: hypothetical protein ACHQLA_04630 [Ignavibacteriales bacterium]
MLAFSVAILINSCSTTSDESVMIKNIEGVNMTRTELSIRLNEFGKYFAGKVEEAADEIIKKSDDKKIKMNALEWKINVIPRAFASLAIIDPLAAGIDITALCVQMEEFFTTGYGKDVFGDYQYIAVDASKEILSEMEKIGEDFSDRKDRLEIINKIKEWAKANQIKSLQFNRRSTFEVMAKTLGEQNYTLGESVGNIAEAIYDIRKQITTYTDYMPKSVKWQAQLTSYELLGDSTVGKSFANFDRIVNATERITKVVEETPSLIENVQESTFKEINWQLSFMLSTLTNERKILVDKIMEERMIVLNDLYQQRIETLERIDSLAEKTINQSSLIATDVVDELFIRALILLALIFAGLIILIKVFKT